ncbi:MAG: phospholipase [Bacteroidetes bacterium]|nr:phospholipase [Bacteroidota bacterium]
MKLIRIPAAAGSLHHAEMVVNAGEDLGSASAAVIMLHGRGATADSIIGLSSYLPASGIAYIAPQATGNVWYPYSFLAPIEQNEPWLSAALNRVSEIVDHTVRAGIPERKIMLLGFSQGASLSLEWTARNARPIGAVFGLSGGLIGPLGALRTYPGRLDGTTAFLGCSDVDFHIPKERVRESADVLTAMNAAVTMRLYPDMDHTVNDDEIAFVRQTVEGIAGT